ncbi:hypothetical protein Aduo_002435 [Ancylostoma duodenale]
MARVLSMVPATDDLPVELMSVDVPSVRNKTLFMWVERANYLIPFVRSTEYHTPQSVVATQIAKSPANRYWTGTLHSDLPDPWYNWLIDAAATMLPF